MSKDGFLRWFVERGAGMLWRGALVVALALVVIVYGTQVMQRTARLFEPQPQGHERSVTSAPEPESTPTPRPTARPTFTPTPMPTETPTPTPVTTPYIVAGADGVNVRSGPDTSNTLLGFLEPNTQAPIIGRQGEWWQITYNGAPAWVFGPLVQAFNAEQVTQPAAPDSSP